MCAVLDHFGDLYGNRLSSAARRSSDAALKAVLRAFSLQWLPNDSLGNGPSLDVYTEAWFRARLALTDAHYVRSFRVVFAPLMFDGIVIPAKLQSADTTHEFLDTGLQSFMAWMSL